MIKRTIITLCFLTVCLVGVTQSITYGTISSGGGFYESPTHSHSWTMGQLETKTLQSANHIATQGFQQPGGALLSISGSVISQFQNPLPFTTVALSGDASESVLADGNGRYDFFAEKGGNYTIKPSKNNDHFKANGVTTLDLTIIRLFLLGNIMPIGPYEIIAADVNRSNTVTTLDITLVRKLILGIDTTFSGRLWAFVPHDHVFANQHNPFPYDDFRSYTNLNASVAEQIFIGIKLGDMNGSWNPNVLKTGAVGEVQFKMDEHIALPGDEITVPVRVKDFNSVAGYQFTLTWDPEVIQFLEVANQAISAYYGEQSVSEGMLTTSWNEDAGEAVTLNDDAIAFELKFKVVGANGSSSEIRIGSEFTQSEAFTNSLDLLDIIPVNGSVKVGEQFTSFNPSSSLNTHLTVQPNPFSNSTGIIFSIAQDEQVSIVIYDALGKEVKRIEANYTAGKHQLEWEGDNMNGNPLSKGLYHIRMETGKHTIAVKAVLMK